MFLSRRRIQRLTWKALGPSKLLSGENRSVLTMTECTYGHTCESTVEIVVSKNTQPVSLHLLFQTRYDVPVTFSVIENQKNPSFDPPQVCRQSTNGDEVGNRAECQHPFGRRKWMEVVIGQREKREQYRHCTNY